MVSPEPMGAAFDHSTHIDRGYSIPFPSRSETASRPHQLAALLKPFGIPTNQTVRRGERTAKGYRAKDFVDAWTRYLPPAGGVTRSQSANSATSADATSVKPCGGVTRDGPGRGENDVKRKSVFASCDRVTSK